MFVDYCLRDNLMARLMKDMSMSTPMEFDHIEEFVIGSGNYLRDRGYVDPEATRLRFLKENNDAVEREAKGDPDDALSRPRT